MVYFWILAAALILSLLVLWFKLPRKSSISDSERIKVSDAEIYYLRKGKGDPIVLLHGWGANIFCWRYLSPLLAEHHTVYEVDLPGFGRSTKTATTRYDLDSQSRRILEWMDEVGIESAKFIGSSMGGAIALWLAIQYPGRVKDIVAIAPAAHRDILPASLHYIAPLGRFLPHRFSQTMTKLSFSRAVTRRELVTDEAVQGYLTPFLNDPDAGITFLKATEALRDKRFPEKLCEVRCPVLVLYGEQDRVIHRRIIEKILDHLPAKNTSFASHPSAGHHAQEDEPQWINEKIREFYKQ